MRGKSLICSLYFVKFGQLIMQFYSVEEKRTASEQKIVVQDLLETLLSLRLSKGFLRDGASIFGRITLNTS